MWEREKAGKDTRTRYIDKDTIIRYIGTNLSSLWTALKMAAVIALLVRSKNLLSVSLFNVILSDYSNC